MLGGLAAAAGVGALGGLIGTGIQGGINYGLQKDAQAFNAAEALRQREWSSNENAINRDFNANEAQKARDFNEMMARNGVQMRVEDMKKAGINPALAGGSASSAAAPAASSGGATGGSSASSNASHVGDPFSSIFSSAIKNMTNGKSKDKLEESIGEAFISNASQDVIDPNSFKVSKAEDFASSKIEVLDKEGLNPSEIFDKLSNDKSIHLSSSKLKEVINRTLLADLK